MSAIKLCPHNLVSSQCVECKRTYQREWHRRNEAALKQPIPIYRELAIRPWRPA